MATVSSTLKLFDSMTGPLKKITQSMNIMISTMHDLQSTTNSNIQVDKMLSVAKQQLASAETEINAAIEKSTKQQNKFNASVSASKFSFDKLVGSIFAVNEVLELTQQIWNGISSAMERADNILSANTRLSFVNDGLQTQAQLQDRILASANKTMASYQDTVDTIAKLGLYAPGIFTTNDRLVNFAETLNKLFVASGSGTVERQIALLQLGQALSSGLLQGDELRSISEAAPLFMDQLAKGMEVARGELKQLGSEGKLTADVVVKAIEKQVDEIDKLYKHMPLTFGGAVTIMGNQLDAWIGKMYEADGPLRDLTALIQNLITWLNSERGTTLFNAMTLGLNTVVMLLNLLGTVIGTVVNLIIDYWPEITAILIALGSYYLPMLITRLTALIPPIVAASKAFVTGFLMAHWPLLLIMGAVFLLIFVLRKLGVSTDQIIGFVTGIFNVFFAAIHNGIGFVWNNILAFAEFLANIFIDPVYAIQKLFYDMLKNVSSYFGNWANSVVDVLNWLISKINEVTGSTIQIIAKQDSSWIEKFKPESNKAVKDLSKYQMQQKDLGAAYKAGFQWGSSAMERISGSNLGNLGLGGNIDKVGEVGKIRDTVDISSEDLRLMRELSEMNAIQNFVSLTPTVHVTGDNHFSNGYDIDTVIARINQGLEEEIASSARMVLNV